MTCYQCRALGHFFIHTRDDVERAAREAQGYCRVISVGSIHLVRPDQLMRVETSAGGNQKPSFPSTRFPPALCICRAELFEVEKREPSPQTTVAFDFGQTRILEEIVEVFAGGVTAAKVTLLDLDNQSDFFDHLRIGQQR